jgi:bacterioferritin
MAATPKLTTVKALRSQARKHLEHGAVTAGYNADLPKVLKMLNEALATEIVCVLRYRRHHFMARGIHGQTVGAEFLLHSNEEQGHADQLAARIVQLGGDHQGGCAAQPLGHHGHFRDRPQGHRAHGH